MKESFQNYFHEREGFTLRSERFYDDVAAMIGNPLQTTSHKAEKMVAWLEAAFEAGEKAHAKECITCNPDKSTEQTERKI